MEIFLLSSGPFVSLFTGVALRIAALLQAESPSSEWRRRLLTRLSYLMMLISWFGMVFVICVAPLAGVAGLMLSSLFILLFVKSEIRYAGMRRRAQQVEFVWILLLAIKSGRPLAHELEAYADGVGATRRRMLLELADRLNEGAPISEISFPQGLMTTSTAMLVHAGVTSNRLEDSLTKSASLVTEDFADSQDTEFLGILMYPPALLIIASIVIGFVMYWIIPKFKMIFDSFEVELPAMTVTLIQYSDMVVNYWYLLGLPIVLYLPVTVFTVAALTEYYGLHATLQATLGRWFVRWHVSDVLRALSLSLSQGTPMNEALLSMIHVSHAGNLHRVLARAAESIEEGGSGWEALRVGGLLKRNECQLLEVAERTGNVPWVLESLARTIETRRDYRIRATIEVVLPLLFIPVALVVAFVVIALFMPLVKILSG